jgi:hypothetical protein
MSELRERLREGADAAARDGHIPTAAAIMKRSRRRRARLVGATAVVVVAVVAGMVATGRQADRPAPLTPSPAVNPTRPTRPTTTSLGRWIPSATPLSVQAQPGPYPGPDPGGIVRDATSLVRGCAGTSRIRLWAKTQGKVWLIVAKPSPPGQQRVCWASAFMNQGGGGALGTHPPRPVKPLTATTAGGGEGSNRLGVVSGTVTKRAVRLRVLFHNGRPMDLVPVEAGNGFPVNFYAGFYLEAGPGPAEDQLPMPAVDRVVAFDQAGRQIAHCRLWLGPANTC